MPTIAIEQATYSWSGESSTQIAAGPPERHESYPLGALNLLARSAGFSDEWRPAVEQTLLAFGPRPVGIPCPSAVFAQPLGRGAVLVVRVEDLDASDTASRPLGFHVIVVPRKAYTRLWHDPFLIAERLPPDWRARGELPPVSWPDAGEPVRTVEQVRAVLRRVRGEPLAEDVPGEEQIRHLEANSESPALLGGAQVLVDGGKLVFQRRQPDTDLVRALWTLLPNSVRGEIWPASFAFGNALGFDVVVVPRLRLEDYRGYTTEELAMDYPEGRFERGLQLAATHGDQQELNALFERRSLRQTWRVGVALLIAVGLMAVLTRPGPRPQPTTPPARVFLAVSAAAAAHQPLNVLPFVHLMEEQAWKEAPRRPADATQ